MVRIEGDSGTGRPVEMVFDFVADQQNEPAYDPRMQHTSKIIDGPTGKGTPFVSAAGSLRRRSSPLRLGFPAAWRQRPGFSKKPPPTVAHPKRRQLADQCGCPDRASSGGRT